MRGSEGSRSTVEEPDTKQCEHYGPQSTAEASVPDHKDKVELSEEHQIGCLTDASSTSFTKMKLFRPQLSLLNATFRCLFTAHRKPASPLEATHSQASAAAIKDYSYHDPAMPETMFTCLLLRDST